jgi:hypothetical protein
MASRRGARRIETVPRPSHRPLPCTLAAALLCSLAAATAAAQVPSGAWPQKEFCGRAQAFVTGSTPRVTNTVHDGLESFRRSAPIAQPLTTQQYDWPDERGAPRSAMTISCKLVTADRVKAVHGAQAARTETSCEQVNRYTLSAVLASLSPAERERALFGQGKKVRFERDRTQASADAWHSPVELASVDSAGRLRLVAQAWRVDWSDPKQSQLPEDARGVHFCHVIAPDYLRRLLLDASIVLPGPPVKSGRQASRPE